MTHRTIISCIAGIILITIMLFALLVPAACSKSKPAATVSLAVDREIKQGDMFAVEVRIDTRTECRGAQFDLSFDPALIRCDGLAEGSFFKDWANANGGTTIIYPESQTIDNNQGHVSTMGIAVIGAGTGGVKGEGVLCNYYFTALADGTAEPTLSGVVVSDVTGQTIPKVKVNN